MGISKSLPKYVELQSGKTKYFKTLVRRIRCVVAIIQYYRNPHKTSALFEISQYGLPERSWQLSVEKFKSHEAIEALIEERYLPNTPDMKKLIQHPIGSLGHAYASHMEKYNLSTNFYAPLEVKDDLSYLKMRGRQTHDIWHVVLDYDTSVEGEIAINAFMLAQYNYPLAALVIAGAIFRTLMKDPQDIPLLVEALLEGWTQGRRAKSFMSVKWEERWEESLQKIQGELGVYRKGGWTPKKPYQLSI